jgi:hypothetical protein
MEIPDEVTDDKILEMIESHRETAEEVFAKLEDDEEAMPVLIIYAINQKTQELEAIVVGVAGDGSMQELMENTGKMFAKEFSDLLPYCITFSSEAWMAKFKSDEEGEKAYEKYGKISKFPKSMKKESLIIAALSLDGRGTLMTYDIKRKAGKRSIKLGFYKPVIDKKQDSRLLFAFYKGYVEA